MLALAASFSDLIRAGQHPIHCAHRTVITAFIEQSGVNRGGRGIDETFAIEGLEDLLSFGLTQCERTGRTRFGRPRVASRRTLTINCSAIDSQRHACRGDSRAGVQWVEGVHQMSSPFSCAVGSPSKVQSFFWTSMTMCARASSARKRTISRVCPASRRFCASARSGFGPRRCGVSASRSASRRCLRHLNSSEEYRPSRLISAPLSPEPVQPSAASRMRCLSAAEKRRRARCATRPTGSWHIERRIKAFSHGSVHQCGHVRVLPMYYKLPKTGVSLDADTGGARVRSQDLRTLQSLSLIHISEPTRQAEIS